MAPVRRRTEVAGEALWATLLWSPGVGSSRWVRVRWQKEVRERWRSRERGKLGLGVPSGSKSKTSDAAFQEELHRSMGR